MIKKLYNQNSREISIEKMFNDEVAKSERIHALILISLLGVEAVFLLIIYYFYSDEYLTLFKSKIAIYAVLIFTSIIIVYEFLIHYILNKKNNSFIANPLKFGYLNSFSEISLLSILFIYIVEYSGQTFILQAPATLTYFIFIVLSIFRLDFKLAIFTGGLAALQFIAISIYYSTYFSKVPVDTTHPDLTGMQYLGQGLIMIITGIAAGFVTKLIKNKIMIAWENIYKKNEVITLFGQQISPQIAENLLQNPKELSGTKKDVCIMFLDIRQFTPFVEKHQPEEVVTYLNNLFGFMIDIVQAHKGVINQFLGDGFMATFGAPVALENSSLQATKAAQDILDELETAYKKGLIPKTRIGIGLHYDKAVTGNIGSATRKQYSITGKVVIMASRIEQLNKKYNTSFLISKEVFEQLDDKTQKNFECLEKVTVKGSQKLISLYKYFK